MKNNLYKSLEKDLLNSYNSEYKIEKIKKIYQNEYSKLKILKKIINFKFINIYKNLNKIKKDYNEKFIKEELEKFKYLFDNIDSYSLDENQRLAVVKEPNSLLVVAAAGSGKTLTIMAKIIYLITKGIHPHEILCLSFTNMAAKNLQYKLKEQNINIKVYTFHKLGLEIIKNHGYNYKLQTNLLEKIIVENLKFSQIEKAINFDILTIDEYGKTKNDENIVDNLFINSDVGQSYKSLFMTFITLFKTNNYNLEKYKSFYKNASKKDKIILRHIEDIYFKYENSLRENGQIDFNDMINKAVAVVLKKGIKPYKYIIVDEFQDTSLARCHLIKSILEKTKAKLMVVGDDWQSIYRFTGCTLNTFINFEKYFKDTEKVFINNVYRNSKQLLEISSQFIMKNPVQFKKKIKSIKSELKPIQIYYYENDYIKTLKLVLEKLKGDVLVLARNNKDVSLIQKLFSCKVMTVHKSKGLEADNVILVNLNDTVLGFPNKVINDPILKYVLPFEEIYPFEEERRLFYVALTRTKNKIILLVDKNNPSIFVTEILNTFPHYCEIKLDILKCPKCGGSLVTRKGKYGDFLGCLNYPKCNYIKKM